MPRSGTRATWAVLVAFSKPRLAVRMPAPVGVNLTVTVHERPGASRALWQWLVVVLKSMSSETETRPRRRVWLPTFFMVICLVLDWPSRTAAEFVDVGGTCARAACGTAWAANATGAAASSSRHPDTGTIIRILSRR